MLGYRRRFWSVKLSVSRVGPSLYHHLTTDAVVGFLNTGHLVGGELFDQLCGPARASLCAPIDLSQFLSHHGAHCGEVDTAENTL